MTATFRFKPALLRGRRSFQLNGDVLSEQDGDDSLWKMALGDVTRAAFVEHTIRGHRMMRLDLATEARSERIGVTTASAGWRHDPDVLALLALTRSVLLALETARPGCEVTVGEYGRSKLLMFSIGVLTAAAGVGLMAAALATGVSSARLAEAAVPVLTLVTFGGWIGYLYRPWQATPRLTPGVLAEVLKHYTPSQDIPPTKATAENDRT